MIVKAIPLKSIEQNENSRVIYKAGDLADLMLSMKKNGLLQPVGVRKLPSGKYDAVFGNRRIAAAQKLGWDEIEAHVMDLETDTDRDIINLIENLKRQNTTVAEDGRMFQVLVDRGLTPAEIAARLDVSTVRVETALDVVRVVPKEYHKSIVNRTGGAKVVGTISASAAHEVLSLRRQHGLTRGQTRKLLDFAQKDETSLPQIKHVAPLVKEGLSVEKAIKVAAALTRYTLCVFADKQVVDTLEKRHGKSYTAILWEQLEKDKSLGVTRTAEVGKYYSTANHRKGKLKTILRMGAGK